MNPQFLQQLRAAHASLIEAHPELATDDDFLADVIEGETDANAIMERLVIERREAMANGEAMDKLAEDYARLSDRWTARAEARRKLMGLVMDATGLRKMQTPAGTVSVSPGRVSLALADDFTPPQGYARTKIEPDKAAIKAALEAGETMPGASLVTGKPIVKVL
jgi:capsid protein